MTARMSTCRDLTKSGTDLKKIKELFMTINNNSTPVSCLMPWFPGPARKSIDRATTELFVTLRTYVEARRRAEPTSDAIDVLIADGDTDQRITGVSSGPVACDSSNLIWSLQAHHDGALCWHRRY